MLLCNRCNWPNANCRGGNRVMRIGINALYLIPGGVGGTEIYLRSLLAAMLSVAPEHDYLVFTNRETADAPLPGLAMPQMVRAVNRPARIIWEQIALPVASIRHKVDVMLNPGFTAPVLSACAQVTVFHDLQHKRHPRHFRWFDLPVWRAMLFASACVSDRLIAVSEATKADLLRYYPVREDAITVIGHGVDERFFHLPRNPEPMLLCVSTLHPHKNLERLLRVFHRFHGRHPDYRLTLAGMKGFHAGPIERLVRELGLQESVHITGWIERERLYELYSKAAGFVYPSTFEGFGMPVLEALAAGLPVACSGIEPLRSVAGDAARLFDPTDEAAMLAALEQLIADAGSGGPARAREFSWEASARATLEVLASLRTPMLASRGC